MASLFIIAGPGEGTDLLLQPGLNRLGSDADNELLFQHDTVSHHHCEIEVQDDGTVLRDPGSTNGTFLDGEAVQHAVLRHGQRLLLGPWVLEYRDRQPEPEAPPLSSAPSLHCHNHPSAPVQWVCSRCHRLLCETCATTRTVGRRKTRSCVLCGGQAVRYGTDPGAPENDTRSFFSRLPGAFAYPFQGNGWVMLLGGAVFLGIAGFVANRTWLIGTLVSLLVVGYLCAFFQLVVQSSAQGEKELPPWPDFGNTWEDVLRPALLWLATVVVCYGPTYYFAFVLVSDRVKAEAVSPTVVMGLLTSLVFGSLYFPMAILAVSMADSLSGLNPLLVIPSIAKVPGQYLVACFILLLLLMARLGLGILADAVEFIPILPPLFNNLVVLYCFSVMCRVLGLIYHANRARLAWF